MHSSSSEKLKPYLMWNLNLAFIRFMSVFVWRQETGPCFSWKTLLAFGRKKKKKLVQKQPTWKRGVTMFSVISFLWRTFGLDPVLLMVFMVHSSKGCPRSKQEIYHAWSVVTGGQGISWQCKRIMSRFSLLGANVAQSKSPCTHTDQMWTLHDIPHLS